MTIVAGPTPAPSPHGEGGFSLIELLVVMTISSIVGVVVLTSVVRTIQVSADATQRVDALTRLERSVERMSRVVRSADPIGSATATTLDVTVYDDAEARRVISYAVVGAALQQTTVTYPTASGPATSTDVSTILDGLDVAADPVFSYQDDTGGQWDGVSPADIVKVQIDLTSVVNGQTLALSTGVLIQNAIGT